MKGEKTEKQKKTFSNINILFVGRKAIKLRRPWVNDC